MPQLDFLVIGDHVRPEVGVFNILAAGVDRIYTELPGLVPLGIAGRIVFTPEEVEAPGHIAELRVVAPDGATILQLRGDMGVVSAKAGLPEDWPVQAGLGLNMMLPIQVHGVHEVTLVIDDEPLKTIRIIVEPPQEA